MMLKHTPEPIRSLLIIFCGMAMLAAVLFGLTAKAQTNQTVIPLNPWTIVGGNITQRTANTPIKITGTYTDLAVLCLTSGDILTTTGCSGGSGSGGGLASSTPWTAGFLTYVVDNGTLRGTATTSLTASGALTLSQPIAVIGSSASALSIADAVADGATKGAASFTANDFNSSSGNISIDYTNGQAAASGVKGFLTGTDWDTFNGKESALTFTYPVLRSGNTISLAFGTTTANDWSQLQRFASGVQASSTSLFATTTFYGTGDDIVHIEGTNSQHAVHLQRTDTGGIHYSATNPTTGQTNTDGSDFGIDSGGNTIIRQREALDIQFLTNGSEKLTVESNGNIGIGTTTPGTLLSLGDTGANTINLSATATSTFGSGLNIRTGCYAVNGVCLSTGGGGITAIGPAGQTQSGATITLASSTSAFNGLTPNLVITGSGDTLTYTSSLSGTLGNAGLTNSTISGIALGSNLADLTATDSSLTFSGSYNGGTARTVGLSAIAANSVLGNITGVSAVPSAIATSSLFAGTNGQVLARVNGTWTGVATTTAGTGLTYSGGAFNVNTSQNIATLSNLTTNGVVYTSGGTGALNVDSGALDIVRGGTATTTAYDTGLFFYNSTLGTYSQASRADSNHNLNWDRTTPGLGIGTTTPWGLLSVNQNAQAGGVPSFVVGSSTATNLIVANNGRVGVGTTTPGSTFSVQGVGNFVANATSTITSTGGGINLSTGCYAVNGTCVGGGAAASTASSTIQTFTADGTWTKPTGVIYVSVEVIGGGGAGDGTSGNNGGGGGGGAYCKALVNVSSLSTVAIDIGTAGAGDTNTGNAGAQSSFGTHVVAGGGAGGNSATGGAGGDCSGTVAMLSINNFDGQNAFVDTEPSADQASSGAGGDNVYGGGGMPISTTSSGGSGSENGRNGTGYGSGGSGAVSDGGETGGSGTDGLIVITEYY